MSVRVGPPKLGGLSSWLADDEPPLFGIDRTGPLPRFRPLTPWERLRRWLGNRVIYLGIRIGGNDW